MARRRRCNAVKQSDALAKENTALVNKEQPQPPELPPKTTKSFAQVASQKVLDTADDVLSHASRAFKGAYAGNHSFGELRRGDNGKVTYVAEKPVILIVGFGWSSHAFSKVIDVDRFDVVIVSPRNHFVFTPMLPATAVGSIEFRSLLEPVRTSNEFVNYFEAEIESIDLAGQTAVCQSVNTSYTNAGPTRFDIPYEYLFYAIGERPATFGTPGVAEHCLFMKEVRDSVRLRSRLSEQFEAANYATSDDEKRDLLRVVVVGGGPTGVEFAGTMADFLFTDLVKKYPRLVDFAEIVLVQSGAKILPAFDQALQGRALQNLETLKVNVMTGVKVTSVSESELSLSTGVDLPYGVCVWSAGNACRPLTADLVAQLPDQAPFASPRPAGQKLAVDDYLRIIGARNAFAAGDCAKIVRGPLPPTAQVAGQEGAYAARAINRSKVVGSGGIGAEGPWWTVEGGKDRAHESEFQFLSLGIMAYIGRSKAVMQVDADLNINLWGQFAFLLWRSVYLTKQVSMRNRILILFDWFKTRVFGRDISLF